MSIQKINEWRPARPCDMVEANPKNPSQLAIGTYELIQEDGKPDKRAGTIYKMNVEENGEYAVEGVDSPGVFDLKWKTNGSNGFAVAGGDGKAHFYNENYEKKGSTSLSDTENDYCLSVGWEPETDHKIAFSSRLGIVHYADADTGEIIHEETGHDHEVWVTTFISENILATGSDDGLLKIWDVRTPENPIVSRRFDAGCTSIAAHPNGTDLVVGSYDENIHILTPTRPRRDLATFGPFGGGIWRTKQSPVNPSHYLVAAMQGGGYVIDISKPDSDPENYIVKHFTQHESMVYGCEWVHNKPEDPYAVTCSFYDKKVCMWR